MPGPDITPPKNKQPASIFIFLRRVIWAGVVLALLAQPFSGRAEWKSSNPQSNAPQSSSTPPQSPSSQSQSGAATQSPADLSKQQSDQNGTFVIRPHVDEALLHE